MNTASIIPCAQVLWGEWPVMSSTDTFVPPSGTTSNSNSLSNEEKTAF